MPAARHHAGARDFDRELAGALAVIAVADGLYQGPGAGAVGNRVMRALPGADAAALGIVVVADGRDGGMAVFGQLGVGGELAVGGPVVVAVGRWAGAAAGAGAVGQAVVAADQGPAVAAGLAETVGEDGGAGGAVVESDLIDAVGAGAAGGVAVAVVRVGGDAFEGRCRLGGIVCGVRRMEGHADAGQQVLVGVIVGDFAGGLGAGRAGDRATCAVGAGVDLRRAGGAVIRGGGWLMGCLRGSGRRRFAGLLAGLLSGLLARMRRRKR